MRMFIVVLALLGNCGAPAAKLDSLLERYARAESSANYEEVFSLFSDRYRQRLRKDYGVITPRDYARFRASSEARWSGFAEIKRTIRPDRSIEIVLKATVEENGERETNELTLTIRCDEGCVIDDRDY